jgi:prolipoprotein diacylglyceryltransferase
MRRVLFRWRGVIIYSYPAMLYLGMVVGLLAQHYAAARNGLDATRTVIATLILLPPALMAARLLFVASHWLIYRREPWRILASLGRGRCHVRWFALGGAAVGSTP